MAVPFNDKISTPNSQRLPPIRKLVFDDEEANGTNSVTEVPKKSFANLFLKKDRKFQSDSFLLLQQKKDVDHLDSESTMASLNSERNAAKFVVKPHVLQIAANLMKHLNVGGGSACKDSINEICSDLDPQDKNLSSLNSIGELKEKNYSSKSDETNGASHDGKDMDFESLSQEYCNKLSLCTNKNIRDPDLNTISPQTVASLLYNTSSHKYLIIDCRYDYEFQGGHIRGALNIESPDVLEKIFFTHRELLQNPKYIEDLKQNIAQTLANVDQYTSLETAEYQAPLIVFHCEFSQKRGPRAFRTLRTKDREQNLKNWPNLYFPEIYILEGGYSNFYPQFPELCEGNYLRMIDKNFKQEYAKARESEKKMWCKKNVVESELLQ